MSKVYKNDIGVDIILDTGVDINDAGAQIIKWNKPGAAETAGVTGSWSAVLFSSYSALADVIGTYFVKHTTVAGDLDITGEWKLQAFVGTPAGTYTGDTADLTVYDEFQ